MPVCGRQALCGFSIILRTFHLKFKIKDVLNKGILYLAHPEFFLLLARGMGKRYLPIDFAKKGIYIDILTPSYHNNGTFGNFLYEKENLSELDGLVAPRPLSSFWMWR